MLRMELPGKKKREMHKRMFMDAVRVDMAEDMAERRLKIRSGDLRRKKPKEEEVSCM